MQMQMVVTRVAQALIEAAPSPWQGYLHLPELRPAPTPTTHLCPTNAANTPVKLLRTLDASVQASS